MLKFWHATLHTISFCWQNITLYILACKISHILALICANFNKKSLLVHAYNLATIVNYHTFDFLPSQSTHFQILHSISSHYKIFRFHTTHLPKSLLLSWSLLGINVLATRLISPQIHFLARTTLSLTDAERAIKSSPQSPAHHGHRRAMPPWVL